MSVSLNSFQSIQLFRFVNLRSVSKETHDYQKCLIRKRKVQGGRWLKTGVPQLGDDCFENKPNAAIGVFLQALSSLPIFPSNKFIQKVYMAMRQPGC